MNRQPHSKEIPAGLAEELRGLYRPPVSVGPRVDEAVLAMARERAAVAVSRAVSVRRMTRWGMVAAAGLAVGVFFFARSAWHPRPTHVALAEDVNGDGVVDILDALALERAIEGSRPGLVDLNGDGVVDRKDVDLVAMRAVALKAEGGNG